LRTDRTRTACRTHSLHDALPIFDAAERERQEAAVQKQAVDAIISVSAQHAKETSDVLDTVLSKILGDPIGQTFGKRATVKVFSLDRKSTRLNSSHVKISYAVFCL